MPDAAARLASRSGFREVARPLALALTHPAVIGAVVAAWALCRNLPWAIAGPDELSYWSLAGIFDPLTYVVSPANSAIQAVARVTFLVAHPFDDWAPAVLRLISSLVIGAFAAFLVSDRMAEAIPSRAVRVLVALSIIVIPVRAPFIQTLNSQWWIALILLGIALTKPRRFDPWLVGLAGLTGIAPCAVLPVFRDRRGLPLAAATAAQGLVYLAGPRAPLDFAFPASWIPIAAAVVVLMALAPLPPRTRMAFAFVGLAWMLLGTLRLPTHGEDRYLTAAWVTVGLALGSIGWAAALRLRDANVSRHRVAAATRARIDKARASADGSPDGPSVRRV